MKVSQEPNGEMLSLIKIEIEENDYAQEVDKQLKSQRKNMHIPGFRTGQVPMSMVKKMYYAPIKAQQIERLMSDNLYKYIDDNKIKVLGSPLANDEKTPRADFEKDTNFTFYFDVATAPEFDLDLKKHKADSYEIEPTDEMIDKFIEDTRSRYGKMETPESVEEKDMLYGHIEELNEDGTNKEDGVNADTTIYMDRIALATIKKQFIGKKKDAAITFKPAKAFKDVNILANVLRKSADEVKDFASDCKFTITSITRLIPAEMNEEFYKKVYRDKEIKDEKAFRQAAIEELKKSYERESDTYFLNRASQDLVNNVKFALPEEFLKRWIIATADEKTPKQEIEQNIDKYIEGIRWQIIENRVAEMHNISVKDDDILNYYKTELLPAYFPAVPDETEEQKKEREEHMNNVAHNMLKEQQQTRQVYNYLFDRQMTNVLKQEMKVTIKKVNMDEFVKVVTPKTEKKTTKKKTASKEEVKEVKDENNEQSLF